MPKPSKKPQPSSPRRAVDAKAYHAAWYAAHREAERAKNRIRYIAHRDEARAKSAARYAAHRQEVIAGQRAYRRTAAGMLTQVRKVAKARKT